MGDNRNCSLILAVDDEPIVIRSVTAALAAAGYRVIVAENGAAGLEAFLADPNAIDLVLADVIMPGLSGLEMVARMQQIRPGLKIVLMSGYSQAVILPKGEPKLPLLRKPFLPEDLVRMISANLDPPAAIA